VISFKADITDVDETERVFKEIVKDLGEVDVLVNNAASLRRRPFSMDNVKDWWRVIEVNLKGVYPQFEVELTGRMYVLRLRFCRV
jgi:3-oxoacyl-[acyl-carrier protein] reductase